MNVADSETKAATSATRLVCAGCGAATPGPLPGQSKIYCGALREWVGAAELRPCEAGCGQPVAYMGAHFCGSDCPKALQSHGHAPRTVEGPIGRCGDPTGFGVTFFNVAGLQEAFEDLANNADNPPRVRVTIEVLE